MCPLFPLECLACGKKWDSLAKTKEEAFEACSACGSEEVQPTFSYPGNYAIGGNNGASVRPKGGMPGMGKKK